MAYIVRRNPMQNGALLNDLDRVWESLVSDQGSYPAVDIIESEENYSIVADLPGISEKELEAKVEDRMLIIQSVAGEKEEVDKHQTKYLIRERRRKEFRRSFVVPKDADLDSISASFSNGVLELTIAKLPESKPRSIEIQHG